MKDYKYYWIEFISTCSSQLFLVRQYQYLLKQVYLRLQRSDHILIENLSRPSILQFTFESLPAAPSNECNQCGYLDGKVKIGI